VIIHRLQVVVVVVVCSSRIVVIKLNSHTRKAHNKSFNTIEDQEHIISSGIYTINLLHAVTFGRAYDGSIVSPASASLMGHVICYSGR